MSTEVELVGIIISLLAVAVAILIPFLIEILKRPELDIEILPEQLEPDIKYRFIHGRVINRPHGKFKWLDRNPAIDTRINMTFYDRGHTRLFRSIPAKWDAGQESITPTIQIHVHEATNRVEIQNISQFDSTKIPFGVKANILPNNEGETFAFIVKHQGQNECYPFNGESYQFPFWSNPNWKIGTGEFIIEVSAISGNSSVTRRFILINNGPNLTDVSLAEQ